MYDTSFKYATQFHSIFKHLIHLSLSLIVEQIISINRKKTHTLCADKKRLKAE